MRPSNQTEEPHSQTSSCATSSNVTSNQPESPTGLAQTVTQRSGTASQSVPARSSSEKGTTVSPASLPLFMLRGNAKGLTLKCDDLVADQSQVRISLITMFVLCFRHLSHIDQLKRNFNSTFLRRRQTQQRTANRPSSSLNSPPPTSTGSKIYWLLLDLICRFRYDSEGGGAGVLYGETSNSAKKTFPKIKVV